MGHGKPGNMNASHVEGSEKASNALDNVPIQDVDEGLKFLQAQGGSIHYTPKEEKRVLRKIDFCLLPLMCFTFGLQFLDRQALAYSTVLGLVTSTKLVGQQYALLTTLYYVAFLASEFPTNFLLQRLPLGRYTSVNVFLWGGSLACMAACKSFSGLAACRVFLGIFEAVIGPAIMSLTVMFYRREEQPLRVGIWYTFQGFSICVGGIVAYAIGLIKGSLQSYQYLFLLYGSLTMIMGIILFFLLPDNIFNSRFFTEREKAIAYERLRSNRSGTENKHFKKKQAIEALKDPKTWLFAWFSFCVNWTGAINAFAALLVQGFGFSNLITTLLNAPAGLTNLAMILSITYAASHMKNVRCLTLCITQIISAIGVLLIICLPSSKRYGQVVGVWLSACGPAGFTQLLDLATSNVGGHTKRLTTNAIIFIAFALGSKIQGNW